jgi:peptide/nickel transport system substrate-binding protein
MRRRGFLAGSAASLALPHVARGAQASVLKFVPGADLPSIDPIWVPAYTARAHGFMVFDTLYGQAGAASGFEARPQMVAGHTVGDDGRTWTLTLRDGLMFHDGTKVLARDCVASIRRWSARDQFGQTLMQRTDELSARDDRTIVFRLQKPFALLPDALGKFGINMCAMMPERLAATDPFSPIKEAIGSGPFRFRADEYVPGSLCVYDQFDGYRPRESGVPDFVSGPKVVHFDRVEWHVHPDPASVMLAIESGELDWQEYPVDDLVPTLEGKRQVRVQRIGSAGFFGLLRMNCQVPPFDNPAVRRALLGAIDQSAFMTAAIGADPERWTVPAGFFPPGSPAASGAGLEALSGRRGLDKVRSDLAAAGYRGEKVVVIAPAGLLRARTFTHVAADLLRRVGMDVDEQTMDNPTWARRLISKKPPAEGGWNVFCTSMQGTDALSPASHVALRGNGNRAFAGWPDCPELEALRDEWLDAPTQAAREGIAAAIQARAFVDVPYIPLGAFYPSTVYRSNLTGVLDGQALFWNVRRD